MKPCGRGLCGNKIPDKKWLARFLRVAGDNMIVFMFFRARVWHSWIQ